MRLDFFLTPPESCPRCHGEIRLSYTEDDPKDRGQAFLYYACAKCGPVLVKVYDISVPKK